MVSPLSLKSGEESTQKLSELTAIANGHYSLHENPLSLTVGGLHMQ